MTDRSKRPAYQWYPGDFRRDLAVQACSFEARALWREMLDLMHDGEPYGHLTAGGVPLDTPTLARLIGLPVRKVASWMGELESRGVFSRTEAGVIYSRRMVRDEQIREHRASNGHLGGLAKAKQTASKPLANDVTNGLANSTPAVAVAVASAGKDKKSARSQKRDPAPPDLSPAPFPKSICDALYQGWVREIGATNYGRFRKALAPLYPDNPYSESEMARGIWAFGLIRGAKDPDKRTFWHPEKFAGDIHEFVRLGRQDVQYEDGTFTELGRLVMGVVAA